MKKKQIIILLFLLGIWNIGILSLFLAKEKALSQRLPRNTIAVKKISEETQEIFDLLGNQGEQISNIYTYRADTKSFPNVTYTLDIYRDGKWTSKQIGGGKGRKQEKGVISLTYEPKTGGYLQTDGVAQTIPAVTNLTQDDESRLIGRDPNLSENGNPQKITANQKQPLAFWCYSKNADLTPPDIPTEGSQIYTKTKTFSEENTIIVAIGVTFEN